MDILTLFTEEEKAVSPVIGVILMVAITVILAAVIGTFVLGLGDQVQETSPNAQFNWDQPDANNLDLTHEGGEAIDPALLSINADTGSPTNTCSSGTDWGGTSEVTAGNTCPVEDGGTVEGEYRLVWTSQSGGSSSVLSRYDSA